MAPNYSITATGYDTTTPTSTEFSDISYIGSRISVSAESFSETYIISTSRGFVYDDKSYKKETKMLKLEEKEEIMAGWKSSVPVIKNDMLRSSIQLRGVCFGGRGWA